MKIAENMFRTIRKHPIKSLISLLILAAMLWYIVLPIDLIPDKIGFFGFVDDALIVVIGLWMITLTKKVKI